jgi:cell division inhibitor SepF
MNIFKKLAKDPEPEAFIDDEYESEYYSDFPKNEDALIDDSSIEEISPVEEPVEDQAEMREPQPMPKKPLEPAKPAVKYYAPTELSDREKAVAKLAEGYIVMLLDVDQLERDVFLRFFDYVMGAVQALEGDIRKINKSTLALIPYGANVDDLDEDELTEASAEQADEE